MNRRWTVTRLRIDTLVVDGPQAAGPTAALRPEALDAALTAELRRRLAAGDGVVAHVTPAQWLRGDTQGDLHTELDATVARIVDVLLANLQGEVHGG